MKKNLLSFLFLESAESDSVETNLAENLEQLFEAAADEVEGELKAKKTPLAKALSEFGISDSDLQMDPEGFCLCTDNRERYSDILTVLGTAEAMHKLAEMGWVVTKPGDAAMTSEPAEYRVRFLEITTVDTGDKDKPDQKVKAINQQAREFATEPLDRSDELNPVETDDGEMGQRQAGVGKPKQGETPEKAIHDSLKMDDVNVDDLLDLPEAQADKQAMQPVKKGTFKRGSLAAVNKSQDRAQYQGKKAKFLKKMGIKEGGLQEMTTTGSMGTVDGGPQGIAGAGIIKKPAPYGRGTKFAMPKQWTVKQPIVNKQVKRRVQSEAFGASAQGGQAGSAEEFLSEPPPAAPSGRKFAPMTYLGMSASERERWHRENPNGLPAPKTGLPALPPLPDDDDPNENLP